MPSVYDYLHFRHFLKDWVAEQKATRRAFSFEWFGRRANLAKAVLPNLIAGRYKAPRSEVVQSLCEGIGFSDEEAEYFRLLIRYDVEPTAHLRSMMLDRLEELRRFRGARHLDTRMLRMLTRWQPLALLELTRTREWPERHEDTIWIAERLATEPAEIVAARALLFELDMLKRDDAGVPRPTMVGLTTDEQMRDASSVSYHRAVLELAGEAFRLPQNVREHQAATFAMPRSLMPQLRTEVKRFFQRMADLVQQSQDDSEEVYQLGIHLFPASHPVSSDMSLPSEDEPPDSD